MDGLFTFTYSDGHVKNTKYYTHQFIYFYCYKDGIILCDNKNVYMYQKDKNKTEVIDNDEPIPDEIDTETEKNSTASNTSKYYPPSIDNSTNIVTTENIYSDTTQEMDSEITEIIESSVEEESIETTSNPISSSEITEALDNNYNSSEADATFALNNYDDSEDM